MSESKKISALLDELVQHQRKKLLKCARSFVPHATPEDIMQPNDFPELENNPLFRYEEGIVDGIQVAQSAVLALLKETE